MPRPWQHQQHFRYRPPASPPVQTMEDLNLEANHSTYPTSNCQGAPVFVSTSSRQLPALPDPPSFTCVLPPTRSLKAVIRTSLLNVSGAKRSKIVPGSGAHVTGLLTTLRQARRRCKEHRKRERERGSEREREREREKRKKTLYTRNRTLPLVQAM